MTRSNILLEELKVKSCRKVNTPFLLTIPSESQGVFQRFFRTEIYFLCYKWENGVKRPRKRYRSPKCSLTLSSD